MKKTILITGARSGIGRATAELLAKKDHSLILMARSEDKLKQLSEKLNCEYIKCDITNLDEIKKFTSQIKNIDVLINNAGVGFPSDLSNLSESEYDEIKKSMRHHGLKVRGLFGARFLDDRGATSTSKSRFSGALRHNEHKCQRPDFPDKRNSSADGKTKLRTNNKHLFTRRHRVKSCRTNLLRI